MTSPGFIIVTETGFELTSLYPMWVVIDDFEPIYHPVGKAEYEGESIQIFTTNQEVCLLN